MTTLSDSIISRFTAVVARQPQALCIKRFADGAWQELSWQKVSDDIAKVAASLKTLGVQQGDRVAIFSKTSYEWTLLDIATLALGAVVVPIYESYTAEEAAFILNDAGVCVVFVGDEKQLNKIVAQKNNISSLRKIVSLCELPAGFSASDCCGWKNFLTLGTEKISDLRSLAVVSPEDTASIVYTSGTTGHPKGAVISHGNILSEITGLAGIVHFQPHDVGLVFLPFAHILARVLQFVHLTFGFVHAYARSIDDLMADIAFIKPNFMVSVPRIFEKIYDKVQADLQNASPIRKKIFVWAVRVGHRAAILENSGKSVPVLLAAQRGLAHRLVFQKLHKKLGGNFRFFISGGAPLPADIAVFFQAFGLAILEGYGLTETTAGVAINPPGRIKAGTVGPRVPDAQFKIADDGEILVRGGMVFKGYYKNPEATAEAFDGPWFKTGDIGRIDADGYLAITDRKKEIIVTAAGKKVAPQNIENLMKSDPYISQFVVHGDRRRFLSAVVTLNREAIEKFAQEQNLNHSSFDELLQNPAILNLVRSRIDEKNKNLAQFETIKKFIILPKELSIEGGELTPTLKIKRRVIDQKYQSLLDGLYAES